MTRLEAGIKATKSRMEFADWQWAQQAKREGWRIIARGKYFANGPEFVELEVPEKYRACCPHSIKASLYDSSTWN